MQNLSPPYSTVLAALAEPTPLVEDTRYAAAGHQWHEAEAHAVVHALASQRPLLVRGEAGCGKSQLARAVAKVLGVDLITEVIHPRYEATDLLYREDPVARLAKAQMLAALSPKFDNPEAAQTWFKQQLAPSDFVYPGPLQRAMQAPPPANQTANLAWPRAVVLIDEIDKADSDLPNALLDVLGNRSFTVQPTGQVVNCGAAHRPLVIITTNEDRELPPAFVRRCAVLNLKPQDDSAEAFTQWLAQRAQAHAALKPLTDASTLVQSAALQVWADRQAAANANLPTVGLAEFLDLLYSLFNLSAGNAAHAQTLLDQVSPYALVKHRDQDQGRAPQGHGKSTGDASAEPGDDLGQLGGANR